MSETDIFSRFPSVLVLGLAREFTVGSTAVECFRCCRVHRSQFYVVGKKSIFLPFLFILHTMAALFFALGLPDCLVVCVVVFLSLIHI